MKQNEMRAKAERYLREEKNDYFRQDLQRCLDSGDAADLNDRFYTELAFGTGGLRGVIGGGANRMNPYNVRRATEGLARYILKQKKAAEASVVIAYDSRRFSDLFSREAALLLCARGIKTYLFSSLRPTPELSFAVRQLKATAGLVVTASHNPPAYNGYKVYWEDGAQIVAPHDKGIIEEVRQVEGELPEISEEEARKAGLLVTIDREIDDAYCGMVRSYFQRPELLKNRGGELKVVYTPLHGTGTMLVERILGEAGVAVKTVPEQREPDGEFPTVDYPNPEEASAMKLALELGEREGADLVIGTDPDADRLGAAVPGPEGMVLISGNQLGALLGDYIFGSLKEADRMPERPVLIKTIVTTELQRLIAESYGARVYDVLTGFKYIGEKIREFETTGESYVFGGEESYGYLVETEVRDKDAVSAAALTVEMALYDRSRGMSLLDHLNDIYRRFGYFEEILISKTFQGQEGKATIERLMEGLRQNTPHTLGETPITVIKDYLSGTAADRRDGSRSAIELPRSNVLQFELEDGSRISARPSGTEPKIKFYASVQTPAGMELPKARKAAAEKLARIREDLDRLTAK